jgi:hypothetical protein
MTTLPLDELVMRTGRATRPAGGLATTRERVDVVDGMFVAADDTAAVTGGATVLGKRTCAGTLRLPLAVRGTAVTGVVVDGEMTLLLDAEPTLPIGGFAAAVGDGVIAELTVGVRIPVF